MQLSFSPRRRALIPSKAVMWARTSAGTPGVASRRQCLLEPGRRLVVVPLVQGDERELAVDPEGLQSPARRSARTETEPVERLLASCALARSPRRAIASRYSRSEPSSRTLSVNCAVAARMSASNATGSRNTRSDDPGGAFGSGNVVSPGGG